MAEQSKFKRVVLKLSGEAMAGEKGFGIDPLVVDSIARQIKDVTEAGLEVRLRLLTAAATSGADCPAARKVWTGQLRTIWACWQR